MDVSSSIDSAEYAIQVEGYIAALEDEELLDIAANTMVAVVQFSEASYVISDFVPIREAANVFRNMSRLDDYTTCISEGILRSMALLEGKQGLKVIDVASDGVSDCAPPVTKIRDMATANGIEINGLALPNTGYYDTETKKRVDQARYMKKYVTNGFVIPVEELRDFERALRIKITMEVAGVRARSGYLQTARNDWYPVPRWAD